MLTYQDYLESTNIVDFINRAIGAHKSTELYRTAVAADLYDRQRNVTITALARAIRGKSASDGEAHEADNRLCSNFFKRLNRQRVAYLLGNGVSFAHKEKRLNENGVPVNVDATKEMLGQRFDGAVLRWAYKALIHGECYAFWGEDGLTIFPVTEFVPLRDEEDGELRVGIRFWRLAPDKPLRVELYEADGMTVFASRPGTTGNDLVVKAEKRPYIEITLSTEAEGDIAAEGDNYPALPVIPMYGGEDRQSTLIGMRPTIDAIDIIASGYANDEQDCASIYWLIQNCGAMTDKDMQAFLRDIRERHIAQVDVTSFSGDPRGALSPYTAEAPYQGREAVLTYLQKRLYEDFGALDVHSIAASSTNDHIDAAYQPLDDEADLLEAQVIDAIQRGLALYGIEDTPTFKRNRVSNVKEAIEAVVLEAPLLDRETALELLPNLTVDQREAALARLDAENAARITIDGGGGA